MSPGQVPAALTLAASLHICVASSLALIPHACESRALLTLLLAPPLHNEKE